MRQFHVIYRGRVQGVGFRWTVSSLAKQFPVTGYVKNLSDGTVELLAVCETSTFRQLDAAIRQRFDGNITDVTIEESSVSEQCDGFQIRR